MRDTEVLVRLAELGEVFTSREAMEHLGLERGSFFYHIRRLEASNMIERLARGRYRLVFPAAGAVDPFLLSAVLVREGAIAYWTALNYYGMTEQIPRITYVVTPVRGNYRNLKRYGIRVVTVSRRKFFGLRSINVSGREVLITTPGKTLADCLDRPRNCGGTVEIVKALRTGVSVNDVAEALLRMGSSAGLRRLGYLCEVLGIEAPDVLGDTDLRGGYVPLDPSLGGEGHYSTRWKLIINVPDDYLEESE